MTHLLISACLVSLFFTDLGSHLPSFPNQIYKMSSWFSFDTLADLSSKLQESLPLDVDIKKNLVSGITKIALLSPDLVAEKNKIDSEEKRKEKVRDSLADLLPYETKDETREILVEDCRDRILSLSTHEFSFIFPFEAPEGVHLFAPLQDDDGNEIPHDTAVLDKEREIAKARLDKLRPLPNVLENFDIDCHVGLIQRMFKVDKNLVMMHSKLSGAGEKEHLFWKNYFVNCAYIRHDLGLTVEEIWAREENDQVEVNPLPIIVSESVKNNPRDDESSALLVNLSAEASPANLSGSETTDGSSSFVKDGFDDTDLDSLEAEIARELAIP